MIVLPSPTTSPIIAHRFDADLDPAISEDEIAPCRILHKYADRFTDKFNIKAGFIDGQKVDTTVTRSLSKLPSRDAVFGQLAGTLNSIVGSLAVALNEVANKMQA